MALRKLFCGLMILMLTSLAQAETWKPAAGPLMTRWAKDVTPEKVLPEYPRPQMERPEWLSLNGVWQLQKLDAGAQPEFGKDLPLQILVPFPVESSLSGVMQHGERFVYRRTFQLPDKWQGKRILLHFGAVDWEATVFVNGKKLGEHRGGYDGFSFDITDALKPAGPQELVVKVFDPSDKGSQPRGKQTLHPEGCFYTTVTGIWQTVWLEPVAAAHIEQLKIVPDVDNSRLRLTVIGVGADAGCTVQAIARDGNLEVVQAAGRRAGKSKSRSPRISSNSGRPRSRSSTILKSPSSKAGRRSMKSQATLECGRSTWARTSGASCGCA